MAYSTGSGDYVALMAAVLAHAIADGWTEAGGVGTGWPIISPSGRIRGIDWSSYTAVEADFTLGGDGASRTQRFLRLGIGSTPAEATTNTATGPICPNMAYTFTAWHIFSEPALNEHIHVVVQFSNGANADVYGHFSFGEVDKGGLTYHSVGYVTTADRRGYALDTGGGASSPDSTSGGNWNTLNRAGNMWAGNWGEQDDGWASLSYMIHSTNAPTPNGVGGWQAWDTQINSGTGLWAMITRQNDTAYPSLDSDRDGHFGSMAWWPPVNAQTGYVNLAPIPCAAINGTAASSRLRWLGVFPNVRFGGMDGINPGNEITFGSDTWKCFPLNRATPWTELNVTRRVTSGYAGYAYKKVI